MALGDLDDDQLLALLGGADLATKGLLLDVLRRVKRLETAPAPAGAGTVILVSGALDASNHAPAFSGDGSKNIPDAKAVVQAWNLTSNTNALNGAAPVWNSTDRTIAASNKITVSGAATYSAAATYLLIVQ